MIHIGPWTFNNERLAYFKFLLFYLILSASFRLDSLVITNLPQCLVLIQRQALIFFNLTAESILLNTFLNLPSNWESGVSFGMPYISRHSRVDYCSFFQHLFLRVIMRFLKVSETVSVIDKSASNLTKSAFRSAKSSKSLPNKLSSFLFKIRC